MSELVVRYGGQYLENGDNQKAAAVIKAAGIAELVVSLLAFALVAATAGLGAHYIAKTQGSEWIFILYAVGLLANFNTETSTGIMQITDGLKVRGTVNLIMWIRTIQQMSV